MATPTFGQFIKKDFYLAAGSAFFPTILFLFVFREKQLAEQMNAHLIGINESFAAIMISAMSLMCALIIGMLISKRLSMICGPIRILPGIFVGIVTSLIGIGVFFLVNLN